VKERDPFTGSLFERTKEQRVADVAFAAETCLERAIHDAYEPAIGGQNSDEIFRLTSQPRPTVSSCFCMAHGKFEEGVAIYIDGKRAKFLCAASAEERGAWKWEGKWPEERQ
jgi:hypothetical protein